MNKQEIFGTPIVGKGATRIVGSDCYAYEVIEVSKDGKTVKLEYLEASADRTKDNQMGHQNWILTPKGIFKTLVFRYGKWYEKLQGIELESGVRYSDFTKEQMKLVYKDDVYPQEVVEGLTKAVTNYETMNIRFGYKRFHYDWSF